MEKQSMEITENITSEKIAQDKSSWVKSHWMIITLSVLLVANLIAFGTWFILNGSEDVVADPAPVTQQSEPIVEQVDEAEIIENPIPEIDESTEEIDDINLDLDFDTSEIDAILEDLE